MKKVLIAVCVAAMAGLTSCGVSPNLTTNQNQAQTSVVLSQNNYQVKRQVSGESKGIYVFGIGNLKKKALESNAINEMMKNANLRGSQAIVNISVKQNIKMITPIYVEVKVIATGTIVEFTK